MRKPFLLVAVFIISSASVGHAQFDNVRTIAGVSGRIIGQALVCGVERSRLEAAGAKAMTIFSQRAKSADERRSAMDLYMTATAVGADNQKNGRGDSCSTVRSAFADFERQLRNH